MDLDAGVPAEGADQGNAVVERLIAAVRIGGGRWLAAEELFGQR